MSTVATNSTPLDPLIIAGDAEETAAKVVLPHAEQVQVLARLEADAQAADATRRAEHAGITAFARGGDRA